MRCIHCDLPLSPTSTPRVCPRCHMPVVTGTNTAAKLHSLSPIPQQTPYPQPGQMWRPPSTPPPTSGSASSVSGSYFRPREMHEEFQPLLQTADMQEGTRPLRPVPPADRAGRTSKTPGATSNLGFVIAGLCVLTGAFLLILVYALSAGLSLSTAQKPGFTLGNSVTTATRHHTPTAVPTRKTQPSPAVTSEAFPARQYITGPQMASAVNTKTAQVIAAATTFHVGQRVYVTFAIHPNGQSGAVCLQWYANAEAFSHFAFAVSSSSTVAYSYTYYATAGPASVEIYWASNVSCNDELLAQRISFAVVN